MPLLLIPLATDIDAHMPQDSAPKRDWLFLLTTTIVWVAAGMAYTLLWGPVVNHHAGVWLTPGDSWATVRAAHYVGWGDIAYLYSGRTEYYALPGFPILLAPVVMLSHHLHLSEAYPIIGAWVAAPKAWLLVGPSFLLAGSTWLWAARELAGAVGLSVTRCRWAVLATAAVSWPAVAMWGHPEYLLSLALACFALTRLHRGSVTSAGWLFGGAIAVQPIVGVLLALVVGVVGWHKVLPFVARCAVIPGALAAAVLIPDFSNASQALINQPSFATTVNRATPWYHLAPRLHGGLAVGLHDQAVAGGVGRLLGLAAAAVLGLCLGRRFRTDLLSLAWAAGILLTLRCFFEAVMVPYYVVPGLALVSLVAVSLPMPRLMSSATLTAAVVRLSYSYGQDAWAWWLELCLLLTAVLVISCPLRFGWVGRLLAARAVSDCLSGAPTESDLDRARQLVPRA